MSAVKRKVDTQQIDYSGYAPEYDAHRHVGKRNVYLERIRFRAFRRLLGDTPKTAKILDVGCGTGRGIRYLLQAGFPNVSGLDYTPAMLEGAARNLSQEFPSHTVQLARGDAFQLPYSDGEFDCVVSMNFLHMFRFDLQQKLVSEMFRVCKPGGRLVCEFESVHKGLFVTRYLEQRRVEARTKFNSVWEIRQIFDAGRFSEVRSLGAVLPKAYMLLENMPRVGELVESVSWLGGLKWLAERILVGATARKS